MRDEQGKGFRNGGRAMLGASNALASKLAG